MERSLVAEGSTILVTGVNGFIASHIADQLLEDGYNVRGSVRAEHKGELLRDHFKGRYGPDRFELVVVEDTARKTAFDEAVKGVAGIIHVATAASFSSDAEAVITATVAGALSVFKSASMVTDVKSIVYTSDSFAVNLPQSDKASTVTTSTYNEDSLRIAQHASPAAIDRIRQAAWSPATAFEMHVYAAAKVAAEKAIWEFAVETKPPLQVSTIIPNMNFGPAVGDLPLASTGLCIPKLLAGTATKTDLLFPAQHFVSVRDCAKIHVATLLDPTAGGQRLFALAGAFT